MGRTQRKRWQRQMYKSTISTTPSSNLPSLYKYMGAVGWRNTTNLTVRDFPRTGRGICSKTHDFRPGDEIIRMPLKVLITYANVEADDIFRQQFNSETFRNDKRISYQALLAFYLLYQKHLNENSPYHAYICNLPEKLAMPYFCPVAELQCFPEAILQKTVAQNRKIRDSFLNLKTFLRLETCRCCNKKLFNDIYTMDKFKWAYFIVNSRSIYIEHRYVKPEKCFFKELLSDEPNLALAPFLDLFNHSDQVSTSAEVVRSTSTKGYDFVIKLESSDLDVNAYTQIYISYGSLTNIKLLVDYGFYLRSNAFDYFEFTLLDIEQFIKSKRFFSDRLLHRNKFKFIRDHNLDDQMFIHLLDGVSHNLQVVLNIIFKLNSHYDNVLSQFAFGSTDQMDDVEQEISFLVLFKIHEYRQYCKALEGLSELSVSGLATYSYLLETSRFMEEFLDRSQL